MLAASALVTLAMILGTACHRGGGGGGGGGGPDPVQAVVFDIDGTLTPSETDFFDVRPYAPEAVEAWLDLGYEVILVTARPELFDLLEFATQFWLMLSHFPDDLPLIMSDEILFTDEMRYEYKLEVLEDLQDDGYEVVYAYGNSSSDFDAYEDAGIPSAHVHALRNAGESNCEPGAWVACFSSYAGHLAWIEGQPGAE
jgi:hypothetical protein